MKRFLVGIPSLFLMVVAFAAAAGQGRAAAPPPNASQAEEIAQLKQEIEELKRRLPSQSHTMMDVDYQFANLWFAGTAENWPLAAVYYNVPVKHIGWAIDTVPVRKTAHGPLDLRPSFDGLKDSSFADLKKTIDGKNEAGFENAYKTVLVGCHSCHQAAEKDYLKPHVPDRPATGLIEMKPSS